MFRPGAISQQEFGRLHPALLNGVMKCRLLLVILSVDLCSVFQQELAQLLRLDRVDETGAPVVVGLLNVGIGLHQDFDNVKMGHVAGAPHGGGSGVGN